jgi:small neutral amino acid transporter SnatA (MarC family)
MHLSETSLSIAGGVILFMIAIRMVFAHPEGAFGPHQGGERAMQAIERLMGLILTVIAVEMLLGGIRAFVEGLK